MTERRIDLGIGGWEGVWIESGGNRTVYARLCINGGWILFSPSLREYLCVLAVQRSQGAPETGGGLFA